MQGAAWFDTRVALYVAIVHERSSTDEGVVAQPAEIPRLRGEGCTPQPLEAFLLRLGPLGDGVARIAGRAASLAKLHPEAQQTTWCCASFGIRTCCRISCRGGVAEHACLVVVLQAAHAHGDCARRKGVAGSHWGQR